MGRCGTRFPREHSPKLGSLGLYDGTALRFNTAGTLKDQSFGSKAFSDAANDSSFGPNASSVAAND